MAFLRKMKKKPVMISIVAIVLVATVYSLIRVGGSTAAGSAVQTELLAKGLLSNTIYVSGTVQSDDSRKVYSTEGLEIKQVLVSEGDAVLEGDALAILDTHSLELDIKQSQLNINRLTTSLSTEATANSDSVATARLAVQNAETSLAGAERDYNNNLALYEAGAVAKDQLLQAETALKNASSKVEEANLNFNSALNKNTAATQSSIAAEQVSLEKLQTKLDKAVIKAPMNGTVTLVKAKVGETANGLQFVVENTQNLIVTAEIGEYDIASVQTGQKVRITTDSTGDEEFSGAVTQISPTANKASDGSTSTSSNVKFEVKITLQDVQDKVKIGMNARMNIVTAEKADTFSVNYEALTDKAGQNSIYVASLQNGKYVVQEIPVTTGLETDNRIEIISPELADGLLVITNPDHFQVGNTVELTGKGAKP